MRLLVTCAAFLLSSAQQAQSQSDAVGQSLCYRIQTDVDALMENRTRTTCIPVAGRTKGSISLAVVSSTPVFDHGSRKKAWLVMTVLATGHLFNTNRTARVVDYVVLSDDALMQKGIGYFIPSAIARTLQRRVKADEITLDEMYSQILRNLKRQVTPN